MHDVTSHQHGSNNCCHDKPVACACGFVTFVYSFRPVKWVVVGFKICPIKYGLKYDSPSDLLSYCITSGAEVREQVDGRLTEHLIGVLRSFTSKVNFVV
jgi:hypothetical protein